MPTVLAYAMEVLSLLPNLISTGIDVISLINDTNDKLKEMKENGTEPTDADWDELNKIVEDLRAQRPDV